MSHDWIIVTNSLTKQKYYYHKIHKTVSNLLIYSPKKYNYKTKYFNSLDKNDLTDDIIRQLTKIRCSGTLL